MSSYTIYIDRDDYQKVETGERNKFIRNVLYEIGIPFEDVWPEECLEPTVEQKIKLRKILGDFDLEVLEEDRGISIYHEKQLIARLNKPIYAIKRDPSALRQSQKTYFEVKFEYWTAFDDIDENIGEENE